MQKDMVAVALDDEFESMEADENSDKHHHEDPWQQADGTQGDPNGRTIMKTIVTNPA